jgi:hypothetical protein
MKVGALLLTCLMITPLYGALAEDNSFNFLIAVESHGTNTVYTFTHGVKVEPLQLPDIETILRETTKGNPVMPNVHTVYVEPKGPIAPEILSQVFMMIKRAGWPTAALLLHIEEDSNHGSAKLAIPFETNRGQIYYFDRVLRSHIQNATPEPVKSLGGSPSVSGSP